VSAGAPLLSVRDLRVAFPGPDGPATVVDGLDLDVGRGERVGIVGESGSGKSVTAHALLGLLRGAQVSGSARFGEVDLLGARRRVLRQVRGRRIGLVFQDSLSALNPVMTVGDQIAEPLRVAGVARREAAARAVALMDRVGIRDAARRVSAYPHEFSGGMRQRIMIAIALAQEPELLIADEPTTALDVRVQRQVLDLLLDLSDERGMSLLLISHDLGVVAGTTDRDVVMYAGRAVEEAPTERIFAGALHPYTWGLLGAMPRLDGPRVDRLPAIGGRPPHPGHVPGGCPFHPRCPYARAECREVVPELLEHEPGHRASCIRVGEIERPAFAAREVADA
jgi:oligopeptide/dipeptide ABC transporter ATP-binding protein